MARKLFLGFAAVALVAGAALFLWPDDEHAESFAPVSEYRVDVSVSLDLLALMVAVVVTVVVVGVVTWRRRRAR